MEGAIPPAVSPAKYLESLFGLQGQTAVIIGGAGVLGSTLARGLAMAGARVVIAGRDLQRGEEVAQEIRHSGHQASCIETEATKLESLQSLLQQVQAIAPTVDMLVNCAGINDGTPYVDIPLEKWNRVFEVNLTATHQACQVFAPVMAAQVGGGSILNIGSVTAHTPLSRVFAYAASKAAVVNLSKNLAREFAPKNVRINILCPGFFPAEQNRALLDRQRIDNIMAGTPMNRFGEPEELIGAAILLLSRRAGSYITGCDMYVDGGFTSMRF